MATDAAIVHRLAALASPQSQRLEQRELLDERMRALEAQYPGEEVPRPPYWGGYRVVPAVIEFWQGRPSRLHDRLLYTRSGEHSDWQISRLSP